MCISPLIPPIICNVVQWAPRDLNPQCILRDGFTARLLQPICIETRNNNGGSQGNRTLVSVSNHICIWAGIEPASVLPAQENHLLPLADKEGLEPSTFPLTAGCSTIELLTNNVLQWAPLDSNQQCI